MNKSPLFFGKKKFLICFLLDNVKKYVMLKANNCKDCKQKILELLPDKIKIISVSQVCQ